MKPKILVFLMPWTIAAAGVFAEETRIVSFGLITDTHVCDKADQSGTISLNASPRYFTGGLVKLESFARAMNEAKVAFVAELGDFSERRNKRGA